VAKSWSGEERGCGPWGFLLLLLMIAASWGLVWLLVLGIRAVYS
jgi:hypothetical protein